MENLIPVINKLQDAFAKVGLSGLDLPQIAVVGAQSSGKSSVLENIVGKDFLPRGTGIVTRRPLVLQLIRDPKAIQEYAIFLHQPDKKIYDFNQVRQEIQLETDRVTGTNKNISPMPINLKIYSSKVVELTLVDLPGLTKVAVGDQPEDIEVQILEMVKSFVEKESCLILAVTPANTDIANSDALQLAKKVDPLGERTIGVLTKLDLMDEGTDCLDILQNKVYPLQHGFVGVVNRSQKEIELKKDVLNAIAKEKEWFSQHSVYRQLGQQCGTGFLKEKLRKTLIAHIAKHLPQLKSKLNQKQKQVEQDLKLLNAPFESFSSGKTFDFETQKQTILLNMIRMFCATIKQMIDGHDGDLTTDQFNSLSLITGVKSLAVNDQEKEMSLATLNPSVRIKHLFTTLFPSALQRLESHILSSYFDDEIRTMIHNFRGLRAGLFVPDAVFELLIKRLILSMEEPSLECVQVVHDELSKMISHILEQSPVKLFPRLLQWIQSQCEDILYNNKLPTQNQVHNLIQMETCYLNVSHPDFLGKQGIGQWLMLEKQKKIKEKLSQVKTGPVSLGQKEGFLTKLGGTRKNWKRRWFVLKQGKIEFFETQQDKIPKGTFSLKNCLIRDFSTGEIYPTQQLRLSFKDEEISKKEFSFEILKADSEMMFRNHRNLVLYADSEREKQDWMRLIIDSIQYLALQSETQEEQQLPISPPASPTQSLRPKPPVPKNKPKFHVKEIKKEPTLTIPDKLQAKDLYNASLTLSPELSSPDNEVTSTDEMTISLVRILIHSYFVIIRKHIQDLVPKAIMLLMVNQLKTQLAGILTEKVVEGLKPGSENILNLLEMSDQVQKEREQKSEMLKMVQKALQVIETEARNF